MSRMKEKTLNELAKEFPEKTYVELEKYRDADRKQEAQQIPLTESQQKQEELEPISKGICVAGEARRDREEMNPKIKEFEEEAERTVKNLEIRLAESLEVNEAHQKINGKLQMRITELEQDNLELHADNKKLAHQIEDRINKMRKAGM
jgi:tRNA A37 N6-isopentenylltransferase MiaA